MQHSSWQENFTRYLSDETDFKNKLKACITEGRYPFAENLLKMSAGKFKVPAEDLQNLLQARAMILFQENDFETLTFLICLSITAKVDAEFLLTLSENTLDKLINSEKDPRKIEWAIHFFTRLDLVLRYITLPPKIHSAGSFSYKQNIFYTRRTYSKNSFGFDSFLRFPENYETYSALHAEASNS